jgi:hypothetical protein
MPSFSNERSTTIDASPSRVHKFLDDFHAWSGWSPWEELDPDMTRTFSGPDRGAGSRYAWQGNNKVGTGTMTITESTPERIAIDLEFLKPFRASNQTVFTLEPAGDRTRVVWTMSGRRNLAMAVAGRLFFDRAIAKDFDKGLAKLKKLAEA